MNKQILIVEDQFIEANDLQLMLQNASYEVCGIARSVPVAEQIIEKTKPDMVLLDIFLKGKQTGIDLAWKLNRLNIPFVFLSANSNEDVLNLAKATQPHGFLIKPFRERDLLVMLEIAWYKVEHQSEITKRSSALLQDKLSAILLGSETGDRRLFTLSKALQSHLSFDYITYGFNTIGTDLFPTSSYLRIGFDEYQKIGLPELATISKVSAEEIVQLKDTPEFYQLVSDTFHFESCISVRLSLPEEAPFALSFYSRKPNIYGAECDMLLDNIKDILSQVIEYAVRELKALQPHKAATAMHESATVFDNIIGSSPLLLNVLDLVVQVAPSNTSVLLLGESGTGKERIADSIHRLSPRCKRPFIKINCAALPPSLIESELFGHEKGAFTGALTKRTGKFEQANGGTILLDEIGDMSADLQVKLLRVLQEMEIEPIGSRSPVPIDVRVIAATNKNLEKEVGDGKFRLDLYYRLNIFPIELPPLRERTEDLNVLATHFIDHFNKKLGKKITGISNNELKQMSIYPWPGNIRELEHLIERAVLLCKGTMIENLGLPAIKKERLGNIQSTFYTKTIFENERDHIVHVLKRCKGRVWGPGGAAEILQLPPSTLKSKMIKLGIEKNSC